MASPYQIGVHLVAHNGVSGVLAAISKDLLGLHGSVGHLQKGFSGLQAGIIGAASALAGVGILTGMAKVVGHGNELVKIQRDMAQAGATATQVQHAYNEAWRLTGQYTNMGAVEILKIMNDARQTFGDQDKAIHEAGPLVQMGSFLKAYEGGAHASHGGALLKELNDALKSGELAGKITPEQMHEHLAQLTAMKVAYGEQVKVHDYLMAQRTAGVALRNTSDSFRYGMFPALVQENGQNAGTMLMTAFNKVVAGVGNRTASLQEMNRLGLLNANQLKFDKVGRVIGLKDPDGIKGSRDAAMHFGDWVMNTLKPRLEKEAKGDPIREAQLISKMFPDRNAAKAIMEIIQQFSKLQKDAENMHKVKRDFDSYTSGSLDAQLQGFKTQWNNLMQLLGAPLVKVATDALRGINSVMASITQWGSANPGAMKAIAYTITALGAALAVLGTVLVGGAIVAAMGLLAPAVGAIGSAVAALAPVFAAVGVAAAACMVATTAIIHWLPKIGQEITSFANTMVTSAKLFGAAVVDVGSMIVTGIAALPGQVAGAIKSAFSAIASLISSAASSMWSGIKSHLPSFMGGGEKRASGGPVAGGRGYWVGEHGPEWFTPGASGYVTANHQSRMARSFVPPTQEGRGQGGVGDVYLDHKKVGRVISRTWASAAEHMGSVGAMDHYGAWAGPGAYQTG